MFDEAKIKEEMAAISARFPSERDTLRKAMEALQKREAKALLAVTFLQPELLYRQEAREYLAKAKAEGTKLTVGDKEAIVNIELEAEKIAYDLAKFDCETTKQQFDKLAPQLSFLQSEMKLG